MDLSIIIPVYNASKLLNRCLDSIFGQETHYSYEVIMVDDGSSDNSVELIKARKEPNIVLFQQQNAGPSVARNKGVELATGTYCAYLDADDYWMQGFIEKTVSFLKKHKDCVAVNVAQRHLSVSGERLVPACYKDYEEPFILDDFYSFWATHMHVCTGSVTIRTEIIRFLGGMRADLRFSEDLEFWALLATKGLWGFIPDMLFVSDGTHMVNSHTDWYKKMKVRWDSTPTFEDWCKRIKDQNSDLVSSEHFKYACGYIIRDFVYSFAMADKEDLARREALEYGKFFIKDKWAVIMNYCKHSVLLWKIMCKVLKYREVKRFK